MEKDKFPLGISLEFDEEAPLVAYFGESAVIAKRITTKNMHGDSIYTHYEVINDSPTEEEIFKVNLSNPQKEKISIMVYTVTEIRYPS